VAANLGSVIRVGVEAKDKSGGMGVVFKVPVVPVRAALKEGKGKGKQKDNGITLGNGEDVFGSGTMDEGASIGVENKGKRKRTDHVDETEEMENANKIVRISLLRPFLTSSLGYHLFTQNNPLLGNKEISCLPPHQWHFNHIHIWSHLSIVYPNPEISSRIQGDIRVGI